LYVLALATDYDGTLASQGMVDAATLAALERFKATGRRLILVTGANCLISSAASRNSLYWTASSPKTAR
jgi:hydroxymethylpyrimidine pyrophosphatase-like HAD family hydrolase